jgi:hypothetical protein
MQGDRGPVLHVPLDCSGSPASAFLEPVAFRLVRRNGFIEYEEEAGNAKRRARSMSDSMLFTTMSAVPFSLPLSCVDAQDSARTSPRIKCEWKKACDGNEPDRGLFQACDTAECASSIGNDPVINVSRAKPGVDILLGCCSKLEDRTTVQIKSIPRQFNRAALLDLLNSEGFEGLYRFVYLPMDFSNGGCLGYADICMDTSLDASKLLQNFQSHQLRHGSEVCILESSWCERQGLDELVSRYRDSPVMHRSVPDEHRPALFEGGNRIKFPVPTCPLRRPRLRKPHRKE